MNLVKLTYAFIVVKFRLKDFAQHLVVSPSIELFEPEHLIILVRTLISFDNEHLIRYKAAKENKTDFSNLNINSLHVPNKINETVSEKFLNGKSTSTLKYFTQFSYF